MLSEHNPFDDKLARLQAELHRAGLETRRNEPMSAHTTYQIGGPADLWTVTVTGDQLVQAVRLARDMGVEPFILGGGANILVADAGIRGLVIRLAAARYEFGESHGEVLLWAEAGAAFQELARNSVGRGLAGLEWAVDIPGSIGGAVVGNAGAFGGYICDVIRRAAVLQPDGRIAELITDEMAFCYRSSRFKAQPRAERDVVLDVTLALRPGRADELTAQAAQYTQRRWERQPRQPSCGSVFKRTANYPAGFLIEQCGLKGTQHGQAMISPQHANFIINLGGATAADVRSLIDLARQRVREQWDQDLELEVELVGEWK